MDDHYRTEISALRKNLMWCYFRETEPVPWPRRFIQSYMMNRIKLIGGIDVLRRRQRQLDSHRHYSDEYWYMVAKLAWNELLIDAFDEKVLGTVCVLETMRRYKWEDDVPTPWWFSRLFERPQRDCAILRLQPCILDVKRSIYHQDLVEGMQAFFDRKPSFFEERARNYWFWMRLHLEYDREDHNFDIGEDLVDLNTALYCCRMFKDSYCTHRMQLALCKAIPVHLCGNYLIFENDQILLMALKLSRHPVDYFYRMRLHILRTALQSDNVLILVRASTPSCHDSTTMRRLRSLCYKKCLSFAPFDNHAALYVHRRTNDSTYLTSIKRKTFTYPIRSTLVDDRLAFVEAGIPHLYTGQFGIDDW